MAQVPAGQEEETKPEASGSAPAPASSEAAATSPVPTAPAPIATTQAVSQAPDSIQLAPPPAAATGTTTSTPGSMTMTKSQPGAGVETKDASGTVTSNIKTPGATQVAPGAKPTTTSKTDAKAGAAPAANDPLKMQSEFIKNFNDLYAKMAEGKDPVAAAEWNSYIQMVAPKHQIAMEAMAMRLRQSGQDGPGAGDALMTMMARDMEMSEDQALAQITAASAKRLHDMNVWGVEKAFQLVKEEKEWNRQSFWDAVKTGQWDLAADLGATTFGVTVDLSSLKASDPATKDLIANGMNTMNQLISQGKADEAKAVAESLAKTNPEAFGFKTAEEALAVVGQMDFKFEAWANLQQRNNDILTAGRNAALSGDETGLKMAIDNWANNQPPGTVDTIGAGIIQRETLADINKYREAAGKTPITEQERGSLSSTEIAKDRQTWTIKNAAKGMNGVDLILNDLVDAMPELKSNPKLYADTRRWIAETQAGSSGSPVPPYDPSSQTVHYYANWPMVYWNGGEQNIVDPDFEIDERSGAGNRDMTTEEGKRQQSLDKGYDNYLSNTAAAERLSAREWFMVTQGGTRPVPENIQTGPETVPGVTPPKTTVEEKAQLLATLKPSQVPPSGQPWKVPSNMPLVGDLYWNPDTGKYGINPNDFYRVMYGDK